MFDPVIVEHTMRIDSIHERSIRNILIDLAFKKLDPMYGELEILSEEDIGNNE
jgi:hypothetical protein